MTSRVWYFGNIADGNSSGHNLYVSQHFSASWDQRKEQPWEYYHLDSRLAPEDKQQVQGRCSVHLKGGWMAIAFWDRTGDRRGASNSVFLFDKHERISFDDALNLAKEVFPKIFARLAVAGIELVNVTPFVGVESEHRLECKWCK